MIEKVYLKDFDLTTIQMNPRNPVKHDLDAINRSIDKNTYITPIIIDENNFMLAGHGRLKSLLSRGETTADVLQVKGLTEEQKRDFSIRDNQTGKLSEWDLSMLLEDFSKLELQDMGFTFSFEDREKNEPAEKPFDFEINKDQDFILIVTDTKQDFAYLADRFGLPEVCQLKRRSAVGRARIVKAGKVIPLLSGNE